MQIIGLTGPTGAGKSTVCKVLSEMGFYIADGDVIARECTEKGSPLLPKLSEAFGEDILVDGELDRKKLARRAFSTEEGVLRLNKLMHPEIERRMFEAIAAHPEAKGAVIDAAALIESGIYKRCDLLCVVLADVDIRLRRVMARDGISEEDARIRIGAQKDDDFYLRHADAVIYNNGDEKAVEAEIRKLMERICT